MNIRIFVKGFSRVESDNAWTVHRSGTILMEEHERILGLPDPRDCEAGWMAEVRVSLRARRGWRELRVSPRAAGWGMGLLSYPRGRGAPSASMCSRGWRAACREAGLPYAFEGRVWVKVKVHRYGGR